MDSKNKISITFRNEQQQETKNEVVRTQKEQAAAVEDKEDERPAKRVSPIPLKKLNRFSSKPVRPLITTAITALFVSLGLGFLLLRMFVSLTDPSSTGSESVPVSGEGKTDTEVITPQEPTSELPSGPTQTFDTYIVQAGAFSTEGKAKEWQSKLTALLVPSMIWQRDGQYFLFVGSSPSKQQADQMANVLTAKSLETYVKPFVVAVEKEIPQELVTPIETHQMGDLSENERKMLIDQVGENTSLGQALNQWESQDDTNINWLKIVQSLE